MNIKDIIALLEQEAELYEEILQLNQQETKALVKGDVKRLDEIVKVQADLIRKVGICEEKRVESICGLAEEMNIEADKLNLSALLRLANSEDSLALRKIQDRFDAITKGFKETNEINSQLIKSSMDFIDYTLSVLLEPSDEVGYSIDGKSQKMPINPTIMDQKA